MTDDHEVIEEVDEIVAAVVEDKVEDKVEDNVEEVEEKVEPKSEELTRRRRRKKTTRPISKNTIPVSILHDPAIQSAISSLPSSYNFEIPKTIHRLRSHSPPVKTVSLQMPEGLLMYSCVLSDILTRFTPALSIIILGDVTYGACCVDDLGAKAVESDYLVHYGHSCLVPLTVTVLPTLYVFVEITSDVNHVAECFASSFEGKKVHIMGTVQFRTAIFEASKILSADYSYTTIIPQAKPLSPGEVLGCTSPKNLYDETLEASDQCMLFIADGRFHLEACARNCEDRSDELLMHCFAVIDELFS